MDFAEGSVAKAVFCLTDGCLLGNFCGGVQGHLGGSGHKFVF
jgi:hypothetical protein